MEAREESVWSVWFIGRVVLCAASVYVCLAGIWLVPRFSELAADLGIRELPFCMATTTGIVNALSSSAAVAIVALIVVVAICALAGLPAPNRWRRVTAWSAMSLIGTLAVVMAGGLVDSLLLLSKLSV